MRQQTRPLKDPAEKVVQDIRRATRKHYSAEEKIRPTSGSCLGSSGPRRRFRCTGSPPNL